MVPGCLLEFFWLFLFGLTRNLTFLGKGVTGMRAAAQQKGISSVFLSHFIFVGVPQTGASQLGRRDSFVLAALAVEQ